MYENGLMRISQHDVSVLHIRTPLCGLGLANVIFYFRSGIYRLAGLVTAIIDNMCCQPRRATFTSNHDERFHGHDGFNGG